METPVETPVQTPAQTPPPITLDEFLRIFPQNKPQSFDELITDAHVKIRTNIIPLTRYIAEHTPRDIRPLYDHIMNREKYLRRFYKTSLLPATPAAIMEQTATTLNNNSQPLLKNRIRNYFMNEILRETKSGFENIPSFMDVLMDLYRFPNCIIDYKLITPSAIDYSKKGRIGSVFSSFYFRASIMNPALVHNIGNLFFPNAKRVLTPTLGWTSYLVGLSSGRRDQLEHYVGIDVIDSVCAHAHGPLGLSHPPKKMDIYNCPSELVTTRHPEFTTIYVDYFDVVFFSPPYYRMELYQGDNQSTTNYKTYEEWLRQYWEQTVRMCKSTLKHKGGLFAYIVSPFGNMELPNDMEKIAAKYFLLREVVPIYNKNVNSTKHREPDDKLYIFESMNHTA